MSSQQRQQTKFYPDWPHTNASQFVFAANINWHIQKLGNGPTLVFIHGTGSSTHSWAKLATLLEQNFKIVCVDLPGHGFTDMPSSRKLSLPNIAEMLNELFKKLDIDPSMVIGHSAGAAILLKMCLNQDIQPKALVSVNGALLPLTGVAGHVFSPAAKLLANIPFIPNMFTTRAKNPKVAERMVSQTGSTLAPTDIEKYHYLLSSTKHVNAALQMMANWDLESLGIELPKLQPELHLIACENDQTISIKESRRVHKWLPTSHLQPIAGLGHLGHEENPTLFAKIILDIAETHNLIK